MGNIGIIAFRNLFGERGRLLITAGGVAFAVLLILVLVGLYQGWTTQMTRFLGTIPADLWVGQAGSGDMGHSLSLLPRELEEKIAATAGVTKVTPFISRRLAVKIKGKDALLSLVGTAKDGFIRPDQISEGKERPQAGEIIIDQSLARERELILGDTFELAGRTVRVAGIMTGGNLLAFSYAFVPIDDFADLFQAGNFVSYYLVQSGQPAAVKARLEREFPALAVMERQFFLDKNAEFIRESFLPLIGVLVLIALGIGTAVIGLTIYTATIEKSREYGVLKAIGYTGRQLFTVALIQSLIAGMVGFVVGNLLVLIVVRLAAGAVTGFLYEMAGRELLLVFLLTLAMSAVAALVPLRRISGIDPAQVFKA